MGAMGRVLVALLAGAFSGGCATGYWADRGRDAADIFTVCAGIGDGARARVGPLQLAVIRNADLVGVRAGQGFVHGSDLADNDEAMAPWPVGGLRPVGAPAGERRKAPRWWRRSLFGQDRFSHGLDSVSYARGKDLRNGAALPVLVVSRNPAEYTQIEVSGGVLFSLRLGFNPGELVDFAAGFATLDLYGDDLSRRDRRRERPVPSVRH